MREECFLPQHRPNNQESSDKIHQFDPVFLRQFENPELFNVVDSDSEALADCVKIFRVTNENSRKPGIFVAPGIGASALNYESEMEAFWKAKRNVYSIEYPRNVGLMEIPDEIAPFVGSLNLHKDAILKAATQVRVWDHEHLEELNIMAHSAGAVDSALAALIDPKKRVRNIVFFCPAGVMDKNRRHLLTGLRKEFEDGARGGLRNWIQEHPLRVITEGLGLSVANMSLLIQTLHKQGVGIFIVGGTKDDFFSIEQIEKFVKESIGKEFVDGLYTFPGNHHDIAPYMDMAETIFTEQEEKRLAA